MMVTELIALAVAVVALSMLAWAAVRASVRYRGVRLVTCPETGRPAAVRIDVPHAAVTAAATRAKLRLSACSLWPAKQDCAQDCLAEITAAPDDCRLRSVLARWYSGKRCALCGRPADRFAALEHKPATIGPDGVTRDWREVRPEDVLDVLARSRPICRNCHVTATFHREFPQLAIDVPPRDPAARS